MIPPTKEDLLRMRKVQAKATPGPCQVNRFDEDDGTISYQVQQTKTGVVLCEFPDITSPNPRAKHDATFDASARTDWRRVTEWALEARRLLAEYVAGRISDGEMVPLVRRLLGK